VHKDDPLLVGRSHSTPGALAPVIAAARRVGVCREVHDPRGEQASEAGPGVAGLKAGAAGGLCAACAAKRVVHAGDIEGVGAQVSGGEAGRRLVGGGQVIREREGESAF